MRARPDQDDYFMMIADAVSCRSTCLRMQYGAVIVKHGQVISTGYNGAPSGIPHCETCYLEEHHIKPGTQYELCQSVHAEANAIIQAAKHGICVDGGTIYVTGTPCMLCARLILNSGLVQVVYRDSGRYDDASQKLMERAGLSLWAIWGE